MATSPLNSSMVSARQVSHWWQRPSWISRMCCSWKNQTTCLTSSMTVLWRPWMCPLTAWQKGVLFSFLPETPKHMIKIDRIRNYRLVENMNKNGEIGFFTKDFFPPFFFWKSLWKLLKLNKIKETQIQIKIEKCNNEEVWFLDIPEAPSGPQDTHLLFVRLFVCLCLRGIAKIKCSCFPKNPMKEGLKIGMASG